MKDRVETNRANHTNHTKHTLKPFWLKAIADRTLAHSTCETVGEQGDLGLVLLLKARGVVGDPANTNINVGYVSLCAEGLRSDMQICVKTLAMDEVGVAASDTLTMGKQIQDQEGTSDIVSGFADVQVAFDSGTASGMGWETDLLAAMPFVLVHAFFAAYDGKPSSLAVACPVAAALLAATTFYAALSGGFVTLAGMMFWAALSDGYRVFARCDGYSLEFLRFMFLVTENMWQVEGVIDPWARWQPGVALPVVPEDQVLGQDPEDPLFEWVMVEDEEPIFNIEAEACSRGWDPHQLMYFVFEHGPREGLAACKLYYDVLLRSGVEDGESVVESEIGFTGGVLAEVSRTAEHPEPAERVRFLFQGDCGLGVREARPDETLSEWYGGLGAVGEDLGIDGYFTTSDGRILAPTVPIGRLGL